MFYLNKALHSKGGGGLTCSLSDIVFKQQFVKKVLEFQNSEEYIYRPATNILGKIPDKNIWVLSDEICVTFYFRMFINHLVGQNRTMCGS